MYSFPIRIGGFIVAIIGLVISSTFGWNILFGIVLIFAGLYFATSATGILIDVPNRSVKHYTSRFYIQFGKWKEYPTYRFISIIRRNKRKRAFYKEQNDLGESAYRYEIYFVSRSHRGKTLLEIAWSREDAEFRAKRYCEMFPAELVEYEPPTKTKESAERKKGHRQSKRVDE